MNPPAGTVETICRYIPRDLGDQSFEEIDQFIARVLSRAHCAAMRQGSPSAARTILELAQAFADELTATVAQFDRLGFLEAVTLLETVEERRS